MSPKPPSYRPTETPQPVRLTLDEFTQFKKLFEDSTLAKYIIMAGISGVVIAAVELVRMLWSAVRWIWKF
jgi:hypothetical protein